MKNLTTLYLSWRLESEGNDFDTEYIEQMSLQLSITIGKLLPSVRRIEHFVTKSDNGIFFLYEVQRLDGEVFVSLLSPEDL
jgi:hypothetical protein